MTRKRKYDLDNIKLEQYRQEMKKLDRIDKIAHNWLEIKDNDYQEYYVSEELKNNHDISYNEILHKTEELYEEVK